AGRLTRCDRECHPVQRQRGPEPLAQPGYFNDCVHGPKAKEEGMPRSSRRGVVSSAADIALAGDGRTTGLRDAAALTSGDNRAMETRQVAVGAVLGLLSVMELAARLAVGSTVRAGLATAPVADRGVSARTSLLIAAFCLLATVPAASLRPIPAALAVGLAAVLLLVLFMLVTIAGAAALLLVAYRLARGGSRLLAVALVVPFLALAL